MIQVIISGFDNPAAYDDEEFLRADGQLVEAVYGLVEAGANADNIADSIKNALEGS